jgi:hypothetical protein
MIVTANVEKTVNLSSLLFNDYIKYFFFFIKIIDECGFLHGSKYCFGKYELEKWTLFYTFDPVENKCIQSWYGNCSTFNYFTTLDQCKKICGQ